MTSFHDEVVDALREHSDARHGAAVAIDRRSTMKYLGLTVPEVRAHVKRGFSFYDRAPDEVLAVWDTLWRESPYGEVLFAAIEYYHRSPRRQPDSFWPVIRGWIERVDNWSHADGLAGLYSQVLERDVATVLPQLEAWNRSESEWERRISIVSLIHYSGKNAVFMPLDTVLRLVTNLLEDPRHYVQTAVGWVLRELGQAYPAEVRAYLEAQAQRMGAEAFSRAIERRGADEKAQLRRIRRTDGAAAEPPDEGG